MLDLILLCLLVFSLAVVITIVGRKFPILASLDLTTVAKEKEARFKEQIVAARLKRTIMVWWNRFGGWLKPLAGLLGNFFSWLYKKAFEVRDRHRADKIISTDELEKQVERLVDDAESLSRQDDFEIAEKKLIEAISLDSKNIEAFRALAHLYFDKKDYVEARQTFEHVLKLNENDQDAYEGLAVIDQDTGDLPHAREEYQALVRLNSQKSEIYFNLALVSEALKEYHEAVTNVKRALAIEENNPRYLDLWLKISIIIKDKVGALEAYEKLKSVNPENQKLEEIKGQIQEL